MNDDASGRKARAKTQFNTVAAEYDAGPGCFAHFGRRLVTAAEIQPGQRALDVASGRGAVLFPCAEQVGQTGQVVGVDLADEMVRATNKEAARRGISARVQVMDAEHLDFPDAIFDRVLCGFGIMFFPDQMRALNEFRRVMKSGGRLIVRTVNRNNFYTLATGRKLDPASCNIYSEGDLRTFLESAGFSIARSFTYGFWPPVGTMYWWYLLNGVLSQRAQMVLSRLTPARHRHNITVFATRA